MNSITITGRLGRNPELKTAQNGTEYTKFVVACDRIKTKENKDPGTDWFNCTSFGRQAVFITTYLKKGSWVLVTGRMQDDPYAPKDDPEKKIHSWSVIVDRIEAPAKKEDGQTGTPTVAAQTVPAASAVTDLGPVSDDDIPF